MRIHYEGVHQGAGRVAFSCYREDLDRWDHSRHRVAEPLATSLLDRVTCRECWLRIAAMARVQLAKPEPISPITTTVAS